MSRFDCEIYDEISWTFHSQEELEAAIEEEYEAMSEEEKYLRQEQNDPTVLLYCSSKVSEILKGGKSAVLTYQGVVTAKYMGDVIHKTNS